MNFEVLFISVLYFCADMLSKTVLLELPPSACKSKSFWWISTCIRLLMLTKLQMACPWIKPHPLSQLALLSVVSFNLCIRLRH
jgi:hypothetical protein